ncbi:outer membrane lipoprotein chaperone LolA [Deefgea sp. CFH1-16]|uniref:outer membrane lipoprotein chaperone LolA n=1 Tax=Deefgea sp. CFH1-16 TaxID=2675457 RepID=UPI0015F6A903|nr:outer membrane lipoprotein chaperone LolA [Deefgea sp. CFH1-16]MBM5575138.1 outer membrane lipoprotein chaperone LolA [Deefgea sp. CFH1-16]
MNKLLQLVLVGTITLFLTSKPAFADNVSKIQQYLSGTMSLNARFTQEVISKNNKIQTSNGQLSLLRPGKFRWVYEKPYPQEIISDGKQVWLYDVDLAQVTIKPVNKALEASPAAILAGDNKLETNFNIKNLPSRAGLDWIELIPKQNDSSFARIRIGFSNNNLNLLELDDHFGQTTKIQLKQIIRNQAIDSKQFNFIPPNGSDIIRE